MIPTAGSEAEVSERGLICFSKEGTIPWIYRLTHYSFSPFDFSVQALDGWFSYLRTQEGLLHKHYESRGLLVLANSIGSVRGVVDKLVDVVKPLAKVRFDLDLLHQAKILHRSLSNINTLLEVSRSSVTWKSTSAYLEFYVVLKRDNKNQEWLKEGLFAMLLATF